MPEAMTEQERYEQGCLSRELPEWIGNISLDHFNRQGLEDSTPTPVITLDQEG